MKRVLIVVVLLIAAAVLGLWRSHGGVRANLSRAVGAANDDSQGEARDEIRKSFELQPGARIDVQGINGRVEIQTSDTKTAEVYVLRTGKNRDSLTRREVTIEQNSNGLVIRGRQSRHAGLWEHLFGSNPREDITINAPRAIALALRGINGVVITGSIEGPLEAGGINGRVELGVVNQSFDISGINGNVSVGFGQLGPRGARLNGINGGIELRLAKDLNADFTAKGMNGNVRSEISEVTVSKEDYGSSYSAKIGSGGTPISLSGINGNVRLTRENTTASTASNDKKSAASIQKEGKAAREPRSGKDTEQ